MDESYIKKHTNPSLFHKNSTRYWQKYSLICFWYRERQAQYTKKRVLLIAEEKLK